MVKRDVSSKKAKLLCYKHIFDRIKANLAEIQPKYHQSVQKTHFLQKALGVNGLIKLHVISSESKDHKPPCITCLHKYVPILEKVIKDIKRKMHLFTFSTKARLVKNR